jgi:membrane protein implicated in regulation of membrane protease activity
MTVFWLVAGAVLLGIEVLSLVFFALFVAVGMFAASIASALGADQWLQVVVFLVVGLAGILLARPPLLRALRLRRGDITLPGVQNLVGQQAVTVDVVGDEHHPGHAMLAGERWLAFTDLEQPLQPDVPVTITAVRGTTLLVRPVQPIPSR